MGSASGQTRAISAESRLSNFWPGDAQFPGLYRAADLSARGGFIKLRRRAISPGGRRFVPFYTRRDGCALPRFIFIAGGAARTGLSRGRSPAEFVGFRSLCKSDFGGFSADRRVYGEPKNSGLRWFGGRGMSVKRLARRRN